MGRNDRSLPAWRLEIKSEEQQRTRLEYIVIPIMIIGVVYVLAAVLLGI